MATKAQLIKALTTSYKARLAVDVKKDLADAIDTANKRIAAIETLPEKGLKVDDASALGLAAAANAKIAAYNAAAVLPLIDTDALAAALAGADDA